MEIQKAILTTLKYSAVFNYPLTEKEIYKYLISGTKINLRDLRLGLNTLLQNKKIYSLKNVYSLNPIDKEVYKTKIQSLKNYKKIKAFTQKDLNLLAKLPFIKFVGITGSTAAKDLRGEFDVDLFFICQKNFVWVARLFVVFYLKLIRKYKNPYCANIYTSVDYLGWNDKNIYIANEIARLKNLINKDNTFERFLQKNLWVSRFLPNFELYIPKCNYKYSTNVLINLAFPLEFFFYLLEYLYMRPKISTEKITLKRIMFLKKDYKNKILNDFSTIKP